jgi:hypothetical protein
MMPRPSFINPAQWDQLIANGNCTAGEMEIDPLPVVKLFLPDAGATWLLTEVDPDDGDRAFGLCDLGVGFPELGYVRISELVEVRGKLGLPVEQDLSFRSDKPLSAYAAEARKAGRIQG